MPAVWLVILALGLAGEAYVLRPDSPLERQTMKAGETRLYRLDTPLNPNTPYEARISYPATVPLHLI